MSQIKFALATARGRSAIATIIVLGKNAIEIADHVFQPRRRQAGLTSSMGKPVYGNWLAEGIPGEDLIVCPISTDHFEIHCHGSVAAIEIICQTLVEHGATQLAPRAMVGWLSGSDYLGDMVHASTLASTGRTAMILLRQPAAHRQFWEAVTIDVQHGQIESAIDQIEKFLAFKTFGLSLTRPPNVVFCGAANVGKSSLVNAILGFNRAIVHDEAGTTRDAVCETTVIDGWPVNLTDTAGIRESSDHIEKQGIQITRQSMSAADLLILVVDLVEANQPLVTGQIEQYRPQLVVGNKSDLAPTSLPGVDLLVSATQRTNVESLMSLIVTRLIPAVPGDNQAVPVSEYHVQFALEVLEALRKSQLDCATQLVADQLKHLGQFTKSFALP